MNADNEGYQPTESELDTTQPPQGGSGVPKKSTIESISAVGPHQYAVTADLSGLFEPKERAEHIAESMRLLPVDNDAQYGAAAKVLKEARAAVTMVDDAKMLIKRPFMEAVKGIDNLRNEIVSPLMLAMNALRDRVKVFAQKLEDARVLAEKEQQDAVLKAAQAAADRGDDTTAETVLQRGSELTVKKEAHRAGGVTTSSRTVYLSCIVDDFSRVPESFKVLDQMGVRDHVNDMLKNKQSIDIDGLSIKTEQRVTIR